MTLNADYMGGDYPYDGNLFPPERNRHFDIKPIQGSIDTSDKIAWGTLCYLSQTTITNDFEVVTVDWGEVETEGAVYICIPRKGDTRFAWTTASAHFPGLIPRTASVTLTSYQFTAGQTAEFVKLEPGMVHWGLVSYDGSGDTVKDQIYYTTAAGFLVVGDAPAGAAPDEVRHGWRCLATTTNMNWGLFQYLGLTPADAA